MSAKTKAVYVCSNCGYEAPKWVGKCPQCNEWNTMEEEVVSSAKPSSVYPLLKDIPLSVCDIQIYPLFIKISM